MSTPTGPIGQLSGPVILTGVVPGYAVIPSPTPLTFLNYYDGKFLRASDLRQEQLGMQSMIELSNQAAGTPGVSLRLRRHARQRRHADARARPRDRSAGARAVPSAERRRRGQRPARLDAGHRAVRAARPRRPPARRAARPSAGDFQPCDLAASAPSATPVSGTDLYLVTLSAAEGLCGTDEVFGRLCDAACVTASDRPWRIEGVLLGLVPLTLGQLATSVRVLLTADPPAIAGSPRPTTRPRRPPAEASSPPRAWPRAPGASAPPRSPAMRSTSASWPAPADQPLFLDEWTARRERIETSPRRYWAGRMAMRPWNVFLAQVLQFQCQLAERAGQRGRRRRGEDPLSQAMTLLGRSADAHRRAAARPRRGSRSPPKPRRCRRLRSRAAPEPAPAELPQPSPAPSAAAGPPWSRPSPTTARR